MSQDLILAAILAICTFIVYWPSIHGGIIMDDVKHITRFDLRSLHGLWRIWFDLGATSQYYPLLHSAFWLEYKLWGDGVTGYHVVNILLHIGSAWLLTAILRQLRIPGAWFGGFLFALHPLAVESVAWISEQKNTLSTFFYLAAAFDYLRFDESRHARLYRRAVVFFVLALLSKSVTGTLPAALLAVFWWQRGRLDTERDLKPMAPLLGIGAAMGLFTAWVERTYIGAAGPDFDLSFGSRLIVAGRVVWFYLGKIFWPSGYLFVYPRWNVASAPAWHYLLPAAVLALVAAPVWLAPRNRAPLAVIAIFLVTQIPVLGFFNVYPFLYSYVWDHFLYLASAAVLAAIAGGATFLARRALPNESLQAAAGAAVVLLLGGLSFVHAGTFRNGETLYTDTLQHNPEAWLAHNNLGAELMVQPGRLPEAIRHFQTALQLRPQAADAHHNLGSAYSATPGRELDAIREYELALQFKEDTPEAHNNLGRDLVKLGRVQEGITHLERAITFNPDFADAHMNLGLALSKLPGRTGDALDQMELALRIDPALPGGRDNLELLLANTPGRAAESISYFEQQVKAHPDSADAHNGLGNALRSDASRMAESIAQFREALRLRPQFPEARMNLANALATQPGRQAEAIGEYQALLQFNPHFPEAHNNLGNALAAVGRKQEAMDAFIAAMHDDPRSADPHINLGAILFEMPGRLADAINQWEQATRINPGIAEAHSNLAFALMRVPGRLPDALKEFDAALRIKPDPELQQRVEQLRKTVAATAPPQ